MFTYLLTIQVVASLIMLFFWLVQLKTKDASLVDAIWALSIFSAILYVFFSVSLFDYRHILIFVLAGFWSLRLSVYLLLRISKAAAEDSRYRAMRQSMGAYSPLGFFLFYQVQALFVTIFTTPIVIALITPRREIKGSDIIGLLVFMVAILGESVADKQLMRFKRDNPGKKITCNVGLWYYSRHPNYFFEWIHWLAYPFFSYGSHYFWISCLAPWVILIFLVKLTGIPHVERESLKNKPDYKAYKASTSAFIPWYKNKKRKA